MNKITSKDFEYAGTNDDGTIIEVICPKCQDKVRLCTDGVEWWGTKCGCGYTWSCSIVVEGCKE